MSHTAHPHVRPSEAQRDLATPRPTARRAFLEAWAKQGERIANLLLAAYGKKHGRFEIAARVRLVRAKRNPVSGSDDTIELRVAICSADLCNTSVLLKHFERRSPAGPPTSHADKEPTP